MRKGKLNRLFLFTLSGLCIVLFSACNQPKSLWKGTIEEKDGVTVVKNPKEPIYEEGVFSSEEELTIGDREIEGDFVFEVITAIRADDNGNIYVLDGKAQQIKVFDKNGNFFRDIGRQGQGPGEYSSPSGLHIISKNEMMVSSITRRLSFFSLHGEFLRQINKSPDPFPVPDSSGNLIVKIMNMGVGEKTVTELKKLDSNFELLFTIGILEMESTFGQKKMEAFSTQLYYTVLHDDSIVWGINDNYQFTIVDSKGKVEKRIIKDAAPVRVTEDFKKSYLERNEDALFRSRGISYDFPEYFPPFRNISSDDEGRIFIRIYDERDNKDNEYYDVFDRQGMFVAKIVLKNRAVYWKRGKLYSVEEDEDGFQLVKRYNVIWNY